MKFKKLQKIFNEKYANIPDTFEEQMEYIKENKRIDWDKVNAEIERIKAIPWIALDFSFDVIPCPCPRPRSTSNGIFYVEGAREHWNYMRERIESEKIIATAVKFRVDSYMPIPNGMNTTEMVLAQMGYVNSLSGGDWDNLGKTYSDAIQQILILNDNIIIEGTSAKHYCIKPRVDIHIEYQQEFDSKFNKRKIESSKSFKKIIGG